MKMTNIIHCAKCNKLMNVGDGAEATTTGFITKDGFEINLEDGYENIICLECAIKLDEKIKYNAQSIETLVEAMFEDMNMDTKHRIIVSRLRKLYTGNKEIFINDWISIFD